MNQPLLAAACISAAVAHSWAQEETDPEALAINAALAESVSASLVQVRYTLHYDKGQPPPHEESLRMEFPHEEPGFLLEGGIVCTEDIMIHPRFIERIEVAFGDQVVDAEAISYGVRQDGVLLRLSEPLTGARPLRFVAAEEGPYHALQYVNTGQWHAHVAALASTVHRRADQTPFISVPTQTLILTELGEAVGLTMTGELPTDGSWKGSPTDWEMISVGEYEALSSRIADLAENIVPLAVVNFRSPRVQSAAMFRFGADEDSDVTEWTGPAVVIDATHAIVLGKFKPRTTARMERIRVFLPGQGAVEATFVGSLKDWGAFVVELSSPVSLFVNLSPETITHQRDRLQIVAEVTVQGENRVQYVGREWMRSFSRGWRGMLFPEHWSVNPYGPDQSGVKRFFFDLQGRLVALPIERREKVTVEERWGGGGAVLSPAPYILEAAARGDDAFDPDNRPLGEDQENRLAWLGVELQGLDRELARLNGVSDRTQDGSIGAIVTYVYTGSPAERMGLEPGDILLRVHADGQPRPLELHVEGDFGMMEAFWENIEQIPVQYFDQIPTPWPNADNAFNRALTDLGFGASARLEVFRNGEMFSEPFTVTQGPDHYNAASRFESESLGMDVRDMTFEVRRYFQLTEEDAGVIVSKLEPGEKAAVAGLKPYEIIIAVNDQPVTSVDQFETLITDQTALRFSVKRRDKGRVVKITMN